MSSSLSFDHDGSGLSNTPSFVTDKLAYLTRCAVLTGCEDWGAAAILRIY